MERGGQGWSHWRRERMAALTASLASRSARNKTMLDRLCRVVVAKVAAPPAEDYMRDPLIDDDQGFDPDELDRYQRGEAPDAPASRRPAGEPG
ncbi:MAG: hypothetical protein AAF909_10230 [Pseudomonadota bacterium]